jgi:hypothetical protein
LDLDASLNVGCWLLAVGIVWMFKASTLFPFSG